MWLYRFAFELSNLIVAIVCVRKLPQKPSLVAHVRLYFNTKANTERMGNNARKTMEHIFSTIQSTAPFNFQTKWSSEKREKKQALCAKKSKLNSTKSSCLYLSLYIVYIPGINPENSEPIVSKTEKTFLLCYRRHEANAEK